MTETENEYRIFVNDDLVYKGSFSEVPDKFRGDIAEALDEWGDVLAKNNLNEMIYSLLAWYEERIHLCTECSKEHEEQTDSCEHCGAEVTSYYKYERYEQLTRLMLCIGMITHVKIS